MQCINFYCDILSFAYHIHITAILLCALIIYKFLDGIFCLSIIVVLMLCSPQLTPADICIVPMCIVNGNVICAYYVSSLFVDSYLHKKTILHKSDDLQNCIAVPNHY